MVFFIILNLLFIQSIHGQTALKITKTDDSRSIVFCYVELYGRIIDLNKKKEKGYCIVNVMDKNGVKKYFVGQDSSYVLREDFVEILGAFFEYTTPKSGADENVKMQIIGHNDGYIIAFTNVPAGFFKITKLQTRKEETFFTNPVECKSCLNTNISSIVPSGTVHFIGSFRINFGFNYCYYHEFQKIGKVIVQDFIRNPKNNAYIQDQSLDECIQLESTSKIELMKIMMKKAGGDWGIMLAKSLEE